ncbi:uncharacterized protein LOC127787117 isoform X1 [Diospyros lotus]|uniref:uncharacterized protein LOC127787117 isoform X1 n=1 Tax=Diospyros lotus TaxID=55363 RepID=UPI002258937B|nr:uncharacterized protein LOC127787117 isoform X1 [Diospyros lotus]
MKKPSAADLLVSPLDTASPNRSPAGTPKQFEFNLGAFNTASSSKRKKRNNNVGTSSILNQAIGSPPHLNTLSSISDLKAMASSRLESVKRYLERSHSEILKDIDSSQSRLHKRVKASLSLSLLVQSRTLKQNFSHIQMQACQQIMDESDKEYKKTAERISQTMEAIKAAYLEIMAEAQAKGSRACKTSIPELSRSFEKALDILKSRYGIQSTAA